MFYSNITLLIIMIIFNYQFDTYFYQTNHTVITIFLLTLVSIMITFIFNESRKDAKRLYEHQLHLNILEERKNNYQLSKENIKKTNILKHDLAHIFNSAIYEIKNYNYQEAIKILSNQVNELENINKVIITGNDIIDYCISLQSTIIKEQKIKVTSDALPKNIPINNRDLFIVFGNLFENAVENCQPNPERQIFISAGTINDLFYIKIKNTISSSSLTHNPKLNTSKSNKNIHGIGIHTCKNIIEKYKGKLLFDEDIMFFNVKIIVPKKK